MAKTKSKKKKIKKKVCRPKKLGVIAHAQEMYLMLIEKERLEKENKKNE